MMVKAPTGGESGFNAWRSFGIGSFVVHETRSERRMPGFDAIRHRPDIPKDFDIDKMLEEMGVDPKTGQILHVMTDRTQLVETSEDSLVLEVEMSSNLPVADNPQKRRLTIPAQEPPVVEGRRVVVDTPECHAEVIRTPFNEMTPVRPPTISQETLTVAGRTLVCQVTESWLRFQDLEMWQKMWTSPEVPGMVVRHEVKADDYSQVMIVTSFEKK